MKILVLGATGRTGGFLVKEALKRGHQVSAIVRNPEKLKDYPIDITQGTPYDYATMEKAIHGCDAVVNTLNVSRKSDSPWAPPIAPEDLISTSATHALKAMEKLGIQRFVALSTVGAGRSWKSMPGFFRFIVSNSNLKFAFRDHSKQEEILERSSINYTICRAPMLSLKENLAGVVVTPEGQKLARMTLSRNSAAEFIIKILESNEYIRETITISNKLN